MSQYEELRDREWLYKQYVDNGNSMGDIADDLGCCKRTVANWIELHDIPTRRPTWERPPYFRTSHHGYERVEVTQDGEYYGFPIHRLLAVAEYGFESVVETDVHHRNGVKWDNRHENIELLKRSEHRAHHSAQRNRDACGRFA